MLLGSLKERVSLEDPDINGSVIFKVILKKQEERIRNELIWLRIRKVKVVVHAVTKFRDPKKVGNLLSI